MFLSEWRIAVPHGRHRTRGGLQYTVYTRQAQKKGDSAWFRIATL
ncbi:hypothetical protein SDC9_12209 [bioreactor metagenome]|uniref:Uncharacterized protein n=1 Tax=bioreactor metagenome TaxID=1076179 RepID=A0A644THU5_9ZZZZ